MAERRVLHMKQRRSIYYTEVDKADVGALATG
jgi:hypothetical protein